jgi:UDP-N-acetylglucosamine 2-epimerase
MSKLTIVTVVGTRPEIIRLSRIISKLDQTVHHILVHTGQNYDPQLNDIFFNELEVRRPDYFLNVDTSSVGAVLGDTLKKCEEVFLKHKPDGILILGDTNSSVAALIAKRMHIPVYHMEAGNRSFDENVPEETNRRMVDHVSDFNLAYTEHARRNLLAEGLHPRRVAVTGSPMREVLSHYLPQIEDSKVLDKLKVAKGGYFLVSAHRQENVDNPARLASLLDSLKGIYSEWGMPVLVSTHPRTRRQLQNVPNFTSIPGVIFHEPFGFFDYIKLQLNARAVVSDSGTVSEEATILGFAAVTIRDSMERPEALEVGGIVMTGLGKDNVLSGIREVVANAPRADRILPDGYEATNVSERVVRFILSTASRHKFWAGLHDAQ